MVEVEGLGRSYGDTVALDGIDLQVAEGEVLALLGPNGAGKTTTVEILATLRAPDRGRARVAGHDVVAEAEAVRRSIALTGQFAAVDEELTGEENLVVFGRLLGLARQEATARGADLLARFDLVDAAATRVRDYSGGMRRRLDLAASLVVAPRVLFLDEPTTGLDPRSRRNLWSEVKGLRDQGITVLLTTQYLEEADVLADRIVVIDRGRVVAEGTPDQLKQDAGGTRCEVTPMDPVSLDAAVAALADLGPVVDAEAGTVALPAADGVAVLTAAVRRLDDAGVEVADISLRTPSLDDVFLALTGDGASAVAVDR
jgi:ABC-2 type transport system ATP-binding protein